MAQDNCWRNVCVVDRQDLNSAWTASLTGSIMTGSVDAEPSCSQQEQLVFSLLCGKKSYWRSATQRILKTSKLVSLMRSFAVIFPKVPLGASTAIVDWLFSNLGSILSLSWTPFILRKKTSNKIFLVTFLLGFEVKPLNIWKNFVEVKVVFLQFRVWYKDIFSFLRL